MAGLGDGEAIGMSLFSISLLSSYFCIRMILNRSQFLIFTLLLQFVEQLFSKLSDLKHNFILLLSLPFFISFF